MNLKTDYQNLYQHWIKELEQSELTLLTQENFEYYRKSVDYITKLELEGKQDIENQLLKSYKYGFKYLFNDFLKIREVKILNASLILQEIDYDNVIEAEKLFYQNLISSIKGFKKLKTLVLYEEEEPIELEKVLGDEDVSTETSRVETPTEEVSKSSEIDIVQDTSEYIQSEHIVQYKYTLIRFNKPSPPLVGIDLINYGPFQENDIANMPYKNAKILIYEKIAEIIDIT